MHYGCGCSGEWCCKWYLDLADFDCGEDLRAYHQDGQPRSMISWALLRRTWGVIDRLSRAIADMSKDGWGVLATPSIPTGRSALGTSGGE
eukprot:8574815-Pyramimonas_sp.AAC.1